MEDLEEEGESQAKAYVKLLVVLAQVSVPKLTFAKYDFPVPGGPYKRMPLQGFRLPAKRFVSDKSNCCSGMSTCRLLQKVYNDLY